MPHDSSPPMKRISLLASSFSGSTLFGIMLCQDDRFVGLGDTYLIPGIADETQLCNCGLSVSECYFRVKLADKLRAANLPAGMIMDPQYRIPSRWVSSRFGGTRVSTLYQGIGRTLGYRRVYAQFLTREQAFLDAVGQIDGYQYYLEGSKNLVRADIFTATNEHCQMIHLVRDPFAVLHSGATRHQDRGRSIRTHLKGWMTYNLRARKLCEDHPERSAVVMFDDLVNAPAAVLERLSSKLGWGELAVDPANLNPGKTHLTGNRSRHTASKVRATQLQPDANELRSLGVPQKELDEVSAAYDFLRQ